jgi:hypothetical protein
MVESSQLVIAQREVPVASFHIGTRALEHFRERGCFLLPSVLLTLTQRTEGASGCTQRSPEVRSTLTKGSPLPDRLGRCHTFAVIGRHQLGMHGVGRRLSQAQ